MERLHLLQTRDILKERPIPFQQIKTPILNTCQECLFPLNNFRFVPERQKKNSLEGSNSTGDFKHYYESLATFLTEVSQNLKLPSLAGKLLQLFLVAFTTLSNSPNLKNLHQNFLCSLISKSYFYEAVLYLVLLYKIYCTWIPQ